MAVTGTGELLQLMRDGRPRTRSDLIELTGLARSTVEARVDALLSTGLFTPFGAAPSTGGRPPACFAFDPRARVVIGAHVGATRGLVALTDLNGSIIEVKAEPLDITLGPGPILDWLVRTGWALMKSAGRRPEELAGVGVGLPGPVEHSTGRPGAPGIMPAWGGYDVPGHVSAGLGGPVLVDNYVNSMTLGEYATNYPEVKNLLFVNVGTGIDAGLISGGRLHRGVRGAAGDLGHVAVSRGGDAVCTCGRIGCLEAIASGPAIAKRLAAQGVPATDSRSLVSLARAGDVITQRAVRQAGRDIGEVLATCVNILNPSVIVVGGILAQCAESLLPGAREAIYGLALPLATGDLQIVASRTGEEAGVIGAATMVIQRVMSADQIDAQVGLAALRDPSGRGGRLASASQGLGDVRKT